MLLPKEQWHQAAKLILKTLNISTMHHKALFKIFEDTLLCESKGIKYDGEYARKTSHRPSVQIATESALAQVIADAAEDGFSERQATSLANCYQHKSNSPFVTRNQVKGLIRRLKPDKSAVERAKQGSHDPTSP